MKTGVLPFRRMSEGGEGLTSEKLRNKIRKVELSLINHSTISLPRKFIQELIKFLFSKDVALQSASKSFAKQLRSKKGQDLTVVFLDPPAARKLNRLFRKRNYATDVLSFTSAHDKELGELVLCPQILRRQAKEHGHSFRAELAYMLIHGVLHLLGYDHEGKGSLGKKQAEKMYRLQDQLFDSALKKYQL